jgi:hypothetical protein
MNEYVLKAAVAGADVFGLHLLAHDFIINPVSVSIMVFCTSQQLVCILM